MTVEKRKALAGWEWRAWGTGRIVPRVIDVRG